MTQVELSQKELNDLMQALIVMQSSIKKRTYESVFTDKDGLIYSNDKEHWELKQKQQINRISKLRKKLYDINVLEMTNIINP
jgi:hypothetical protein